jgi:hypothetical protein
VSPVFWLTFIYIPLSRSTFNLKYVFTKPLGSARGFENAKIQQTRENCEYWYLLNLSNLVVHHYSQFFKAGNYLGAISAYSHAISIGSKMPALYSNRAAAHTALGNLHKTIEDCSTVSTNKCCSLSTVLIWAIEVACSGKSLPMFWDNLSVPSSRVKNLDT